MSSKKKEKSTVCETWQLYNPSFNNLSFPQYESKIYWPECIYSQDGNLIFCYKELPPLDSWITIQYIDVFYSYNPFLHFYIFDRIHCKFIFNQKKNKQEIFHNPHNCIFKDLYPTNEIEDYPSLFEIIGYKKVFKDFYFQFINIECQVIPLDEKQPIKSFSGFIELKFIYLLLQKHNYNLFTFNYTFNKKYRIISKEPPSLIEQCLRIIATIPLLEKEKLPNDGFLERKIRIVKEIYNRNKYKLLYFYEREDIYKKFFFISNY